MRRTTTLPLALVLLSAAALTACGSSSTAGGVDGQDATRDERPDDLAPPSDGLPPDVPGPAKDLDPPDASEAAAADTTTDPAAADPATDPAAADPTTEPAAEATVEPAEAMPEVSVADEAGPDDDGGLAPPVPGDEHIVNEATAGDQLYPVAAALSDGRFVVAFQGPGTAGASRVLLRCLDVDGLPQGPGHEVDADAPGDQQRPALAALEGGGFAIAWHATKEGQDPDVALRRFAGCGLPAGPTVPVNVATADAHEHASLAPLPGQSVAVAWETSCPGFPCVELDGSWSGVLTRRLDASGTGAVEQIANTYTMGQQENADVAPLVDGGWLVTWASLGQVGTGWDVYAQRFAPEGAKLGAEARVNEATDGLQSESDTALLADGRVLVAWTSRDGDGSGGDVRARLLDADGAPQGSEFALARWAAGVQLRPSVAALPGGGFVAGWDDDALDGSGHTVVARIFDAGGQPQADEAVLPLTTTDDQRLLDLAPDGQGGWLAVWASRGQDGDGWSVVARRFVPP